jgi:hypothetical protein
MSLTPACGYLGRCEKISPSAGLSSIDRGRAFFAPYAALAGGSANTE